MSLDLGPPKPESGLAVWEMLGVRERGWEGGTPSGVDKGDGRWVLVEGVRGRDAGDWSRMWSIMWSRVAK